MHKNGFGGIHDPEQFSKNSCVVQKTKHKIQNQFVFETHFCMRQTFSIQRHKILLHFCELHCYSININYTWNHISYILGNIFYLFAF